MNLTDTQYDKLFQFDELKTERAKEKAREWYRRAGDGDTSWSESVLEDAREIAKHCGFTTSTKQIYFSGFSSQGDGACFVGSWYARDVRAADVIAYAPQDAKLHAIASELERIAIAHPAMAATLTHHGNYSHEMSVRFEFGYQEDSDESTVEIYEADSDAMREASRDLMRWIYRALETEYEYQNSDEQIDEAMRANEYEFFSDGSFSE